MRLSILLLAGLVLIASREGHIVRMRLEGISDAPTLAPTRTRRSVEP